jgi:CHAD domain-containing protein
MTTARGRVATTRATRSVVVPTLPDNPSAADAVQRAIAASVQRLLRNDPVVRKGEDPEGVHQARVATRRLRSDLRTFAPLLDAQWLSGLRDELRDLAAQLGAVRDADVLLERLQTAAKSLPEADRDAAAHLLADLAQSRDRDRAALLSTMRSLRYRRLVDDLVDAAAHPGVTDEADRPGAEVLPQLAAEPWRRLRRKVNHLDAEPPDADLHEVRIYAKRARYAAEAVAPVAGAMATEFARAVAAVQEVLGNHHDAIVAHAWLREASNRHPTQAFVAGSLAGLELVEAQRCREAWPASWTAASAKRLRSWM